MDHVVLVIGFENADLNDGGSAVWSDEHREVRLVGTGDGTDCIVDGMADVVVEDSVLVSTRPDLHSDNCSCHQRRRQPTTCERRLPTAHNLVRVNDRVRADLALSWGSVRGDVLIGPGPPLAASGRFVLAGRGCHADAVKSGPHLVTEFLRAASNDPSSGVTAPVPRHDPAPDFSALEDDLAARFPGLQFRFPANLALLYAYVLPAIDCGLIRWLSSPRHQPLGDLRRLLFDSWVPEELAGDGVVPIADDGNDGGPLCLDVREQPGEFAPVVLWDHELRTSSTPLYDDFDALLRCSTHLLVGGRVQELGALGGFGVAREFAWWDE